MPIVDEFEAESDAFTLIRAKEIEADAGRIMAARNFAEQQKEKFEQMGRDLPEIKKRPMNNSVRNSKMEK